MVYRVGADGADAVLFGGFRLSLRRARGVVQSKLWTIVDRLFGAIDRAAAIRHQVLAEHDERARGDNARERLWNRHFADVGVDGAIEAHVFGERVDEHQGVVDVRANDGFLGACSGEPESAFGRGLELAAEDALWKQPAKKGEHGCNLRD